jgi:electron transfer flavoprotein alpha/beta subunit
MIDATTVNLPDVVSLEKHLERARAARWKGKSKADKTAAAKKAASAYWDQLSPEQRSIEMKRRAEVRAKNRKKKNR